MIQRPKVCLYLLDVVSSDKLSALLYSTRWCCDRHGGDFDLASFFQGPMYTGNEPKVKPPRSKSVRNRPVADRKPLRNLLRQFRLKAHDSDSLRAVRPACFILSDIAITTLTKVHPIRMKSAEDVVSALEETNEWGIEWSLEVFDVIHTFDNPSADPTENDASDEDDVNDSPHESESGDEAEVPISLKRRRLAEQDIPAKRQRGDTEEVVGPLRRSSRAVKPTYRILQSG
jgi:hypothetical protein